MSSGVARTASGSFVGTGATKQIRSVGFRPRVVEIFNTSGLATGKWSDSMADASVVKRVTAGTMTFPATLGVTPDNKGFDLGADTDLNVSGETVHWVAYE